MITFADYIFDIIQNSFSAHATKLTIEIIKKNHLLLRIKDNGDGMKKIEVKKATSPFYTTRTTRKIGLGLSLIVLLANQTNGSYQIRSIKKIGTKVTFKFDYHHIDFPNEGNYGMLIADISSHQQLKHLTFLYQDQKYKFKWKFKHQSRQFIINQINQYTKNRGGI